MKKILFLALSLSLFIACSNDDDGGEQPQVQSFDYNEDLSGDLSNDSAAPTSLPFVLGQNTVTATHSSSDVDYITFTVPEGHVLSQIVVDNYESTDDAAFIGIALGKTVQSDAMASDLLGGLVYGVPNRGNNILPDMGTLSGAVGFTGALLAGDYSVWLNQTGAESEVSLNFIISKLN